MNLADVGTRKAVRETKQLLQGELEKKPPAVHGNCIACIVKNGKDLESTNKLDGKIH